MTESDHAAAEFDAGAAGTGWPRHSHAFAVTGRCAVFRRRRVARRQTPAEPAGAAGARAHRAADTPVESRASSDHRGRKRGVYALHPHRGRRGRAVRRGQASLRRPRPAPGREDRQYSAAAGHSGYRGSPHQGGGHRTSGDLHRHRALGQDAGGIEVRRISVSQARQPARRDQYHRRKQGGAAPNYDSRGADIGAGGAAGAGDQHFGREHQGDPARGFDPS